MKSRQLEDLEERIRKAATKPKETSRPQKAVAGESGATDAGIAAAKKVVEAFRKALAHAN